MPSTPLSQISLLAMDVDGTLTDGILCFGPEGQICKNFYVRDGMGIVLLHRNGIQTAIITMEDTPIIQKRAAHLGIRHVMMGIKDKEAALLSLAQTTNISLKNIAYIGDDINDLSAMKIAGYTCCPSDAHSLVKEKCHEILPYTGGRGAVRHICDQILLAQNLPLTY